MGITALRSGGFRASEEMSVDVKDGSAGIINLTNVRMNSSFDGTQFGFDIGTTATTWFMTKAFNPQLEPTDAASGVGQIYYEIPGASITVSNPSPNTATLFSITEEVAGTEPTTLDVFTHEQAYFTLQVDAPKVKYMRVYNNFLLEGGDPCNRSRVWISELLSPNIWSEFGGTQGSFLDIDPDDGDEISGICVWTTFAFIFKYHSVHRINFTGDEQVPFTVEKLAGKIGALSHFAIQETDKGIIFLSEKGPAICRGYYVTYTSFGGPEDAMAGLGGIDPLFDSSYISPLNFEALKFSVSANDTQHRGLWFSVT